MKNKGVIIGVIAVLLVILVVGGYFVLGSRGTSKEDSAATVQPQPTEEPVKTLLPEDIGLSLRSGFDKKRVIMEIVNTDDIASLDYELSYNSKGDIPRGAIGHIDIKTKGRPVSQEIVLGTCSDVCHYDQEVSDIKLILKVVKTDNTVHSIEDTLDI